MRKERDRERGIGRRRRGIEWIGSRNRKWKSIRNEANKHER